jgi:hypothetical protein
VPNRRTHKSGWGLYKAGVHRAAPGELRVQGTGGVGALSATPCRTICVFTLSIVLVVLNPSVRISITAMIAMNAMTRAYSTIAKPDGTVEMRWAGTWRFVLCKPGGL